jgi:hypothetical protein
MRIKVLILHGIFTYLFSIFLAVSVHSETVHDFRVNTDSSQGIAQYYTDIAFDSSGNFVIVYSDRGVNHSFRRIFFQRFDSGANPLDGPILVSDTSLYHNDHPCVAMHPSGSFVICWGSSMNHVTDIWIRRYESSGCPLGSPQKVDVQRPDPEDLSMEGTPDIAMDQEGRFMVVWRSQESGSKLYAQRFSYAGKRRGINFLVNPLDSSDYPICPSVQFPKVTCNSEGYFFICWHSCIAYKPSRDFPLARIYGPEGEPVTRVFPLILPDSIWAYGAAPHAASNSKNNFVVSFILNDTLGTYPHNAVMVRTFDPLGNPLSEGRIVNDTRDLGDVWFYPYLAVDSADGYVVLWSDRRTITTRNLWAQRFNSLDQPQGRNYRINIPPGFIVSPDGQYGDWVMHNMAIWKNTVGISWVDYRNWEIYNADIYAKLLDLDAIGYYLPGDVVLDGIVDTVDLDYLIDYLLRNGWGLLPKWTGDVNADGEVDLTDAVYLVSYLFKNGSSPRMPKEIKE